MTKTHRIEKLQEALEEFSTKRDWKQYHTPKNLAMALCVECSELLEIFQWVTPDQSLRPDNELRDRIYQEIGDIMIYLSLIGTACGIDPITAAFDKMKLNEKKYPCPAHGPSSG